MRSPAWWPTNTVERRLWERKLHSEKTQDCLPLCMQRDALTHIPHGWVHSWWGPENDPGSLSKPPRSASPLHLLWSIPKLVFELPIRAQRSVFLWGWDKQAKTRWPHGSKEVSSLEDFCQAQHSFHDSFLGIVLEIQTGRSKGKGECWSLPTPSPTVYWVFQESEEKRSKCYSRIEKATNRSFKYLEESRIVCVCLCTFMHVLEIEECACMCMCVCVYINA